MPVIHYESGLGLNVAELVRSREERKRKRDSLGWAGDVRIRLRSMVDASRSSFWR